jgi:hypothetical protein
MQLTFLLHVQKMNLRMINHTKQAKDLYDIIYNYIQIKKKKRFANFEEKFNRRPYLISGPLNQS